MRSINPGVPVQRLVANRVTQYWLIHHDNNSWRTPPFERRFLWCEQVATQEAGELTEDERCAQKISLVVVEKLFTKKVGAHVT